MWETLFGLANGLALVMWIGLIALPRWPALLAAVRGGLAAGAVARDRSAWLHGVVVLHPE